MVAQVLQRFKSTCDGGESANCTSGSVAVVGQVLDRLGEHGDIGVAQNLQRLAVVSVRCGAFSGLGRSEERPSFDGLCGEKAPICSRPNPIEPAPDNLGRTVAVDLADPGGAEILRAAVVSYRHFFNQFFSKP